ncbi:MAG: 16S rRNA (cytosine(1402)-N(4))-methyltransferase, partial [bacterium]|nr:16S rRNA (cytosine(1402)-N(4))-methyltransferase [bacterium]
MAHIPVLLKEVVESLNPQENDFVIDGTVDGGGHMKAILPKLGSEGIFLGVDWDEELAANCTVLVEDLKPAAKAIIVNDNFRNLPEILKEKNLPKASCLLLDLGFSTEQLTNDRGFSFSGEDSPLSMTYNSKSESLSELLKKTTVRQLAEVIKNFGEERYAIGIAEAIKMTVPKTTRELAEIIRRAV